MKKDLHTIGVVGDSTCRICGEDEEDSQHMLGEPPRDSVPGICNDENVPHQQYIKVLRGRKSD